MKKFSSLVTIVAILLAAGIVFAGANYISGHYLSKTTKDAVLQCPGRYATHTVIIQNSELSVVHTKASLCDTLTIMNADDTLRLIAFGEHEHHESYDGVTEKLLSEGQSLTVILDKTGTFKFHDHLHDEVQGDFTVTP